MTSRGRRLGRWRRLVAQVLLRSRGILWRWQQGGRAFLRFCLVQWYLSWVRSLAPDRRSAVGYGHLYTHYLDTDQP